jgi:beta-glucanase (GH16 family)
MSASLKAVALSVALMGLGCAQSSAGLLWSDEFNGTQIDPAVWTYDVGGGGFGNGQFEYDTARHENSYITNGNLVIEARRESYLGNAFTSARMMTQGRFAFKYGALEARIKMPNTANGLWPAFWMMGNNAGAIAWAGCGEIDIVEMGSKDGIAQSLQQEKINCAVHYSDTSGAHAYYVSWTNAPIDLSQDYHLYKLSWTPTALTFYLDGSLYGTMDITADYLSEFHQPFFPILNLAIGGYNPSYTGVYSPDAVTATFPARMYVDWIRLYDNPYTELYLGAAPETGNFGVLTETTPVNHSLAYVTGAEAGFEYGTNAALYIWNNMTPATGATPSEGGACWSFDIAAGAWFGMGALAPNFRNMSNYSDGFLHLDLKTTGSAALKVGIKSSRGGEFWLPLGTDATSEFGFARDGQWHSLKIPLNRFANIDFLTVHQFFMIAGDAPSAALNLSIDNVWWEPSVARPTPAGGNFGVFTETALHKTAGEFGLGTNGNFFIWDYTLNAATQTPAEGSQCISLTSAAGQTWFGAAFTPNVKYDLSAYGRASGKLRFSMKTSSTVAFMIGMKSGNIDGVGQKWISFQSGSDPYSFVRDGQWHTLEIPMSDLAPEVDFSQVAQLFQVLGTSGPITGIQFDDIYFTGSSALTTNVVSPEVLPAVAINWPTLSGTNYAVQCTTVLATNAAWTNLATTTGTGATNQVFDLLDTSSRKFYRILQNP